MYLEKAFNQIEHNLESVFKKRFSCSHCGKTWVEIVGLFAGNVDGKEELYFQTGLESEACQNCRFRVRSCPACGSKDAYEINLASDNAQVSPVSFDSIRVISNT